MLGAFLIGQSDIFNLYELDSCEKLWLECHSLRFAISEIEWGSVWCVLMLYGGLPEGLFKDQMRSWVISTRHISGPPKCFYFQKRLFSFSIQSLCPSFLLMVFLLCNFFLLYIYAVRFVRLFFIAFGFWVIV